MSTRLLFISTVSYNSTLQVSSRPCQPPQFTRLSSLQPPLSPLHFSSVFQSRQLFSQPHPLHRRKVHYLLEFPFLRNLSPSFSFIPTPRRNVKTLQTSALTMSPCQPTEPQHFLTLSPTEDYGYYIFGSSDFQVKPLKVANVFHRSFAGSHEDFILGVLSVLLIAILTEIFQVVLMRTYRSRVTRSGFHAAFALDEITHFRNVFSHVRHRSRSRISKSVMWSSLTILTIGAILIAAEVFAVYITQPFKIYAPPDRYNLRGIQPIQTFDNVSIEVDKLTTKKRCVSPMMPNSNQSREYALIACVDRDIATGMTDLGSKATYVEISSWFHKAGSDHRITYGNDDEEHIHKISTRASVMQSDLGITNGILFEVNQSRVVEDTKYLQVRAIQAAIKANCNDLIPRNDCAKIFKGCRVEDRDPEYRQIPLWEVKKDTGVETVEENVRGVVQRFNLQLQAPGPSLKESLRIFAASAAIQEVLDDRGKYVSLPDGDEYTTMERLVSEEGRIAGIVLLAMVLILMLGLLILLRTILKPISLARLARDSFDAEEEEYREDDYGEYDDELRDTYPGPGSSQQSVWAVERDIVEPDLDDYGSTDMFDIPRDPPPRRGFWRPHDRGPV